MIRVQSWKWARMVRLGLSVDLVFNAPQMVSFIEFADFWRVI